MDKIQMFVDISSLQNRIELLQIENEEFSNELESLQKELQERDEAIKRGRRIFKLMCEKQRKDRDKINELYEEIEKYRVFANPEN